MDAAAKYRYLVQHRFVLEKMDNLVYHLIHVQPTKPESYIDAAIDMLYDDYPDSPTWKNETRRSCKKQQHLPPLGLSVGIDAINPSPKVSIRNSSAINPSKSRTVEYTTSEVMWGLDDRTKTKSPSTGKKRTSDPTSHADRQLSERQLTEPTITLEMLLHKDSSPRNRNCKRGCDSSRGSDSGISDVSLPFEDKGKRSPTSSRTRGGTPSANDALVEWDKRTPRTPRKCVAESEAIRAAIEDRDKARAQVDALLDFAKCLNELEIRNICVKIMGKARSALVADRCTMFLVDEEKDELVSYVADGGRTIRIPRTAGIAGACAMMASTINIPDAYADGRFNRSVDIQTGYKTDSLLCMAICTAAGKVIGVVQMINKQPKGKAFNEDDEKILSILTIQAAVAIENAKLFERTKAMQLHYETILTSIPDIVMTLDGDGRLTSINQDPEPVFGMAEAAMRQGKHRRWWEDTPCGEDNKMMIADIDSVLENGELRSKDDVVIMTRGRDRKEKKKYINYKIMPMKEARSMNQQEAEPQKRCGVVMILEDITASKLAMDTLGKYVSFNIAEHLLSCGPSLGGQRLKVSVLFVDIRDFTRLSERMSPEDVVLMLNEFFAVVGRAIGEEKGTVDKYIGDCAMAVFGVPQTASDDTVRAARGCLKIVKYVDALNVDRVKRGLQEISIGVGLNTGDVLAGNIGSDDRMEYTVIGDGVNLASRVEGLTKLYGVRLMCTENTYDEVRQHFWGRKLDTVRVVGKKLPVRMYEILGPIEAPRDPQKVKAVASYAEALVPYCEGRFQAAMAIFERGIALGDLPCKIMHTRCKQLRTSCPENWDGTWTFSSK